MSWKRHQAWVTAWMKRTAVKKMRGGCDVMATREHVSGIIITNRVLKYSKFCVVHVKTSWFTETWIYYTQYTNRNQDTVAFKHLIRFMIILYLYVFMCSPVGWQSDTVRNIQNIIKTRTLMSMQTVLLTKASLLANFSVYLSANLSVLLYKLFRNALLAGDCPAEAVFCHCFQCFYHLSLEQVEV